MTAGVEFHPYIHQLLDLAWYHDNQARRFYVRPFYLANGEPEWNVVVIADMTTWRQYGPDGRFWACDRDFIFIKDTHTPGTAENTDRWAAAELRWKAENTSPVFPCRVFKIIDPGARRVQ